MYFYLVLISVFHQLEQIFANTMSLKTSCNDWNQSKNKNQYNLAFKITKFPPRNREFWKSWLLWIPRNVKIWVPSLTLVTYTHQISALGDSSTTRYVVNNIFQRDARTYLRTYEHSPVRRKCSFGANLNWIFDIWDFYCPRWKSIYMF